MKSNIFLVLGLFIVFTSCKENKTPNVDASTQMYEIQGNTMGTYYVVKYEHEDSLVTKEKIDELLKRINQSINTYDASSIISQFNNSASTDWHELTDDEALCSYFLKNHNYVVDIHKRTEGAYDPTVAPLVNHWGFGYVDPEKMRSQDPVVIEQLMESVGYDKIALESECPLRAKKEIITAKVDYSSVAKGQAVDEIADLLTASGITNHYVEIGGECRASGAKITGPWKIGISYPDTSAKVNDIVNAFPLVNMSVASSGNYRNYYTSGGKLYGHTINAKTGYPEVNDLLSATIFAQECGYADAIATACMTLGSERALALVESIPGVESYLITGSEEGIVEKYSSGAKNLLKQ